MDKEIHQALTWFADIEVHGCTHVQYFLNNGLGQCSRSEQNRSSPLGPLKGDGTVRDQVQISPQFVVWVSSICSGVTHMYIERDMQSNTTVRERQAVYYHIMPLL